MIESASCISVARLAAEIRRGCNKETKDLTQHPNGYSRVFRLLGSKERNVAGRRGVRVVEWSRAPTPWGKIVFLLLAGQWGGHGCFGVQ